MVRARSTTLVLMALVLAACGSGSIGRAPINGVLLRAADLPDMRLFSESPVLQAFPFYDAVGHGILFKDPVKKVIDKLKAAGFERAYAERFTGAGTVGAAFIAEFSSAKDLNNMLSYMNDNLFESCPGEPQCSIRKLLKVSAIPGSYGQEVHPTRTPDEGKEIILYKVIFSVGSSIFGMEIGGDEVYDPGTVSQSQALAAFKDFYEHVKSESVSTIFAAVPKTPVGPPPPGPPPGAATSVPPGSRPSGSPS